MPARRGASLDGLFLRTNVPLTLNELTTPEGVATLAKGLPAASDQAVLEKIRAIVTRALARDPQLKNVAVETRPGFNNAVYNFDSNKITTGLLDPDVLGHEMGHAANTIEAPVYQKLLRAVRGLAYLNQTAAIPAMLGMHAFLSDAKRKDIVNTLAGVSSALTGPILNEELGASINAVINSDDKIRTLKRVLPAFGAHAVTASLPGVLYSIDSKL